MHRLNKIEIVENILGQELRVYFRDEHGHEMGAAVHLSSRADMENTADAFRQLAFTIYKMIAEAKKADPFGN